MSPHPLHQRLLFVRHAVTEDNLAYRFIGHTDTPLHPLGYKQALFVAESLVKEPISCVVSSPLQRAWQTATTIAEKQASCTVLQDARLSEINLGMVEGLSMFTAYEDHKDLIDEALDEHTPDFSFPDGERRSDALERMVAAIDEIRKIPTTRTICVVTHGAMLGLWRCFIEKQSLGAFQRWQPSHGSISEVTFSSDKAPMIVRWNDMTHLPRALTVSIEQARKRLP